MGEIWTKSYEMGGNCGLICVSLGVFDMKKPGNHFARTS